MRYDLEIDSSDFLLHCAEVILMRKAEYQEFLDFINEYGLDAVQGRKFTWQKLYYLDGYKLESFDQQVLDIINEVDSRGEY